MRTALLKAVPQDSLQYLLRLLSAVAIKKQHDRDRQLQKPDEDEVVMNVNEADRPRRDATIRRAGEDEDDDEDDDADLVCDVVGDGDIYGKWWVWYACNYNRVNARVGTCLVGDRSNRSPDGYQFLHTDKIGKCDPNNPTFYNRKCTIAKGTTVIIRAINGAVPSDYYKAPPNCVKCEDTTVSIARDILNNANGLSPFTRANQVNGMTVNSTRTFSKDFFKYEYTLQQCPDGLNITGNGVDNNWVVAIPDGYYWLDAITFHEVGKYTIQTGGSLLGGDCYATK